MKKKGFTLIELLAVIIVLAIIALIAMPIIFNVIENAKVKSLENSAYGVVDAVRLQYMENLMNSEDGEVLLSGSVTTLPLSGEHPTAGTWKIDNEANSEDVGIRISGVTFASMQGYVCDSEETEQGELTGKVICSNDKFTFTSNQTINENGWSKENINVKVTAEGVTNLKYCLGEEECTPNQTLADSGVDITTNGSTYLCVQGDGTKVRCNIYNLDKTTPTLTASTTTPTIKEGVSNEISTYLNTPTYGPSNGSLVCKTNGNEITNTSSLAVGTHTITCNAVGNNGLSSSDVTLTIKVEANKPEPNEPELFSNMIPVTYNTSTSKWKYADISQEWYNYGDKEWANAVVLKANPSKTYTVNTDIEIEDIAQMYVWIPRYKYTIFNGNNGSVTTPIQINVEFEEGTATTGTVRCYDAVSGTAGTGSEVCTDSTQANNAIVNGTSTYTHPAFCLGRKKTDGSCDGTELEGIWVGKFETSGTAANLTVLPNVNPLVNQAVINYFIAMSGVSSSFNLKDENDTYADSHMMKNMEWGAVTYLKQSEYGLGTTEIALNNYYDTSKSVYYMTGCGSAVGTIATTTTCAAYHTANGQAASTTGNIYGVYDMSGGAEEYVMGNIVNESGEFYPSASGMEKYSPAQKYYDVYTYNTSNTFFRSGKLGDATKEILAIGGGLYGDRASFPYSAGSWFIRGGYSDGGSYSGIFSFAENDGSGYHTYSSRLVITKP